MGDDETTNPIEPATAPPPRRRGGQQEGERLEPLDPQPVERAYSSSP